MLFAVAEKLRMPVCEAEARIPASEIQEWGWFWEWRNRERQLADQKRQRQESAREKARREGKTYRGPVE